MSKGTIKEMCFHWQERYILEIVLSLVWLNTVLL